MCEASQKADDDRYGPEICSEEGIQTSCENYEAIIKKARTGNEAAKIELG